MFNVVLRTSMCSRICKYKFSHNFSLFGLFSSKFVCVNIFMLVTAVIILLGVYTNWNFIYGNCEEQKNNEQNRKKNNNRVLECKYECDATYHLYNVLLLFGTLFTVFTIVSGVPFIFIFSSYVWFVFFKLSKSLDIFFVYSTGCVWPLSLAFFKVILCFLFALLSALWWLYVWVLTIFTVIVFIVIVAVTHCRLLTSAYIIIVRFFSWWTEKKDVKIVN